MDAGRTFETIGHACKKTEEVLEKVQLLEDGIEYVTSKIYEK